MQLPAATAYEHVLNGLDAFTNVCESVLRPTCAFVVSLRYSGCIKGSCTLSLLSYFDWTLFPTYRLQANSLQSYFTSDVLIQKYMLSRHIGPCDRHSMLLLYLLASLQHSLVIRWFRQLT